VNTSEQERYIQALKMYEIAYVKQIDFQQIDWKLALYYPTTYSRLRAQGFLNPWKN
jgi:hypothetical protein